MKIKQFAKDHKKELIVTGIVIGAAAIAIIAIKAKKDPTKELNEILKGLAERALRVKDLPKPSWEGMEIFEHWTENEVQNMILTCHVCDLGPLGEHLMNDMLTQANPDIPIEMVLSYGSSCWIGA